MIVPMLPTVPRTPVARHAIVLALGLFGSFACGSSDDAPNAGAPGGAGSVVLSCDDEKPRLSATPTLEPAVIPAGQSTEVTITIPVTRSAYRIIVQMSDKTVLVGGALGTGEQAYNDAGCSVSLKVVMHEDVKPGQYYPQINIRPDPKIGPASFVDYYLNPMVSKASYTLTPESFVPVDTGIAVGFVTVQ